MAFLIPSKRLDCVESCDFSGRKVAEFDTRKKCKRGGKDYRSNPEKNLELGAGGRGWFSRCGPEDYGFVPRSWSQFSSDRRLGLREHLLLFFLGGLWLGPVAGFLLPNVPYHVR